jgi:hypothetical protein
MRKIALVADPECPVKARIEIRFHGGKPPLTAEPVCRSPELADVARKFVETLTFLLPPQRIQRLLSVVDRIDQMKSLAELSRQLATLPTRRLPR